MIADRAHGGPNRKQVPKRVPPLFPLHIAQLSAHTAASLSASRLAPGVSFTLSVIQMATPSDHIARNSC